MVGLRQVVVRTRVEPLDPLIEVAAGGQHEDRYREAFCAKLATQFEAVEAREEDVEDDQIVVVGGGLLQAGFTVGRDVNSVGVFAEALRQKTRRNWLVFNDEYSHLVTFRSRQAPVRSSP